MRIAVDIKAFKNGSTGIARYLRSLLDELQVVDTDNDYYLFECAPTDYKCINPRWKKILVPFNLPGIIWQQLILPSVLKENKIDLLWAPEQICPVILDKRINVITTVHDFAVQRFPETCQKSNYYIQTVLFPKSVHRSNLLIPVSNYIANECKTLFPQSRKKLEVVTNGFTLGVDSVGIDEREDFIFFAGNMEPRKNLNNLLKALEILHERQLDIPLRISGPKGWKNNKLLQKIQSSLCTVKHLGYISEEQLKTQYRTCKAVVYPSLYEGFGLPVLEALAYGAPLITSKNTVMEEIAGDAAFYFDPHSPDDIAGVLADFYDGKLHNGNYAHSRETILQTYTWKKSAVKLKGLFENVR